MKKPEVFLFVFVALTVTPCSLAAQEEPSSGEDFTRRDRTALLYSTKFLFTAGNVPIVRVSIMDGQDSVTFGSDGPLEFLPEGEGGAVIRVGKARTECAATIRDGVASRLRFWVALARVPARDLDAVRQARESAEAKGRKVKTFERGSVFGFFGRVLDNRIMVIVEDSSFDDLAAARARRDRVAAETGTANAEVFEEVVNRPSGRVVVRCEGLDATLEFPGMVTVAPSSAGQFKVRAVEFGRGFSWHGREDRQYRGQLVLAVDRNGRLGSTNSLDAETLLKGLVPSEIYVDAPPEALKTQAVCARAELYAKLGTRHFADPYMVCSDVHCQAYRGAGREDPRTSKAVDATRGEMPFFRDGLVDAVYSASCGGHTEDGGKVWQGAGHEYLTGVPDGPEGVRPFDGEMHDSVVTRFIASPPPGLYCGSARYGRESFRWEKTVSASDVRSGVKEQAGRDVGNVTALAVKGRGASGRVTSLEVRGDAGTVVLSPELTIRKALNGLKSSLFVFEDLPGPPRAFRFRGAGFGHGVGMCQVGAIGMAEKGADYKAILRHYYQGGDVVKIY